MSPAEKKFKLKVALPIKIKLPESFINEPLFLFLKNNKLKHIELKDPRVIFAIAFIVGILDDVFIGALSGNWHSIPGVVGVLDINNIPPLMMSLIVEPGIWAFFVGFPPALFDLFHTIQKKGILLTEQENIQTQVNGLKNITSSRLFIISAILLAIAIAFYAMVIIGEYQPTPWLYFGWHYWLRWLRIACSSYVSVYAVSWSLMALFTLYNVFYTAKVKVNIYDGDNAGGLLFIGKFILKVSRLTLIIVPLLIAETLFALRLGRGFVGQFNLWLEIIILPILLFIMVSLPLSACRHAMIVAKDEYINPLRDKIPNQVAQIYLTHQITKPQLEDIIALIDFQAKLRKDFPTWPFDMTMTQQFGLSLILSLLPFLFNIIQQISLNFGK